MAQLDGKVAIVTGGGSGIGLATTKQFLAEGAKVAVGDFSDKAQEVIEALNTDDNALFVKTDVTNEDQIKNLIAKTVEKFGKLDVMFANAGILNDGDITDLELNRWQRTIDINLTGVYLADKYAVEQMLKQGNGGSIVNTGSIHSLVAMPSITAYGAAKVALRS